MTHFDPDSSAPKPETDVSVAAPAPSESKNSEPITSLGPSLQVSENSEEARAGARARRRNSILSIVCGIVFFALLFWALKTGKLSDTKEIQNMIEAAGPFGPVLFIVFSVFTSYVPLVPMGSMGSIGIVVFGALPAFFYNTLTSYINCFLAYGLARHYGIRLLLQFAAPKTVTKYENWLKKSRNYELFFAFMMMMPVSPDLVLCMIAGLLNMKFSHFFWIILISRPFSSWCYSTGLLKVFEWLRKAVHL